MHLLTETVSNVINIFEWQLWLFNRWTGRWYSSFIKCLHWTLCIEMFKFDIYFAFVPCDFLSVVGFMSAVCCSLLICVRKEAPQNGHQVEQDILETFDEHGAEKVGGRSFIVKYLESDSELLRIVNYVMVSWHRFLCGKSVFLQAWSVKMWGGGVNIVNISSSDLVLRYLFLFFHVLLMYSCLSHRIVLDDI